MTAPTAAKAASPPRVLVSRIFVGICHMQVCAEPDATDEEILEVCNRENPAGTSNGWYRVLRADEKWIGDEPMKSAPVQCEQYHERLHFLVAC